MCIWESGSRTVVKRSNGRSGVSEETWGTAFPKRVDVTAPACSVVQWGERDTWASQWELSRKELGAWSQSETRGVGLRLRKGACPQARTQPIGAEWGGAGCRQWEGSGKEAKDAASEPLSRTCTGTCTYASHRQGGRRLGGWRGTGWHLVRSSWPIRDTEEGWVLSSARGRRSAGCGAPAGGAQGPGPPSAPRSSPPLALLLVPAVRVLVPEACPCVAKSVMCF